MKLHAHSLLAALALCVGGISSAPAAVFNVVTQYSATGNGTTDDTAAINNAIVAANSAAGTNTVYFPAGTYLVNNLTINTVSDVIFDGDGAMVSILKRKPSTSPQQNRIATVTSGTNVTFQNLGFDANGIERYGGVAVYSTTTLLVQKVRCYDSAPVGPQNGYDRYMFVVQGSSTVTIQDTLWEDLQIEVDTCTNVDILRNVVKRPRETGGIGIWALHDGDAADDYLIKDNWIIDPTRCDAGAIVVHLDGPTTLSNCSFTNIQVLNNTIIYSSPAIGTLRPTGIKFGTTNSASTGTGNVFNYITVQGNKTYVDPGVSDTFARDFIWFWSTQPTVYFQFANTNVSNNNLYYNGVKNPLSISSSAKGANWVDTNNVKSAYVTPPPVPNPLGVTVTTATGAGADAETRRGASTTNHGQLTYFTAHNGASATRQEKSWFRFDVSGINPASIAAATLTLTYIGNAGGGTLGSNNAATPYSFALYGLLDSNTGNSWPEGNGGADNSPLNEITWTNAPGNNTGNGSGVLTTATYNSGVALATFTITGSGTVGAQIPLSSTALTNFLKTDTDGVVTFILVQTTTFASDITSGVDANTYDHSFAGKEHATYSEPVLSIN